VDRSQRKQQTHLGRSATESWLIDSDQRVTQFDTPMVLGDIWSMPSRSSLNVSLTPQLEQFIESRLATGRYQTASEVIREGLRLLEFQERDREAAFKALKKKLRHAAGQARRGEVMDGERFFSRLFTRLGRGAKRPPAA
jgi:antitoxin ParD1/3/4